MSHRLDAGVRPVAEHRLERIAACPRTRTGGWGGADWSRQTRDMDIDDFRSVMPERRRDELVLRPRSRLEVRAVLDRQHLRVTVDPALGDRDVYLTRP